MSTGELRARLALADAEIHADRCRRALLAQLEHDRAEIVADLRRSAAEHPEAVETVRRWMAAAEQTPAPEAVAA